MDNVNVWFGRSWTDENVFHFMEEGEPKEYAEVEENGVPFKIPVFNSEVESWLARTDMQFCKFNVTKEQARILSQKFNEYDRLSWQESPNKEKLEKTKQIFLSLMEQLKN